MHEDMKEAAARLGISMASPWDNQADLQSQQRARDVWNNYAQKHPEFLAQVRKYWIYHRTYNRALPVLMAEADISLPSCQLIFYFPTALACALHAIKGAEGGGTGTKKVALSP
eukprot:1159433-Pelagomonas_calceolata.AAC.8